MTKVLASVTAFAFAAGLAVSPQTASAAPMAMNHPSCPRKLHWIPAHRDRKGHWVTGHCGR
jgi:hypothetical protein